MAGAVGSVTGGPLAVAIWITSSLLSAFPAWETRLGGFPTLNPLGQFLIKDVVLLDVVVGECLSRMVTARAQRLDNKTQRWRCQSRVFRGYHLRRMGKFADKKGDTQ